MAPGLAEWAARARLASSIISGPSAPFGFFPRTLATVTRTLPRRPLTKPDTALGCGITAFIPEPLRPARTTWVTPIRHRSWARPITLPAGFGGMAPTIFLPRPFKMIWQYFQEQTTVLVIAQTTSGTPSRPPAASLFPA